jgi:hypothetical protein
LAFNPPANTKPDANWVNTPSPLQRSQQAYFDYEACLLLGWWVMESFLLAFTAPYGLSILQQEWNQLY